LLSVPLKKCGREKNESTGTKPTLPAGHPARATERLKRRRNTKKGHRREFWGRSMKEEYHASNQLATKFPITTPPRERVETLLPKRTDEKMGKSPK